MKTEPTPLTATIAERQPFLSLVSNGHGRLAPPSALTPALKEKLARATPPHRRNTPAREAALQAHLSPTEPDRSFVEKPLRSAAPAPAKEPEPVAAKKSRHGGNRKDPVDPKIKAAVLARARAVQAGKSDETLRAIAKEHGLGQTTISNWLAREKRKATKTTTVKKKNSHKLTTEQRAELVRRALAGESRSALAKEYGCSRVNVDQLAARAKQTPATQNGSASPAPKAERMPRGMGSMDLGALAKELSELQARVEKVKKAMRKALGAS